jgi:hypothetical protein
MGYCLFTIFGGEFKLDMKSMAFPIMVLLFLVTDLNEYFFLFNTPKGVFYSNLWEKYANDRQGYLWISEMSRT